MPPRPITRRTFLKTVAQVAATYTVAGVSGYVYGTEVEASWLEIKRLTLPIRNLPPAAEGLRLVQLSDFHLRPYTPIAHLRAAVALANQLRPDVTVLTGDYVTNDAADILELAPVLGQLNARLGVFASLGNHDLWTDRHLVTRGLEAAGLPVLVNRAVALPAGRRGLWLAGLDDSWSGQPDLGAALAGVPAAEPALLLAHEPDFADDYLRDQRVALMLSGHSHGGQIRLPGYQFLLPPHGRKYDRGLYRVHDRWLYTNAGLGLAVVGLRLFCRPEITEITLSAA
ncbi:MAG: metallophosphoesterase [Anaerolineales bacterium]|nr:metallophosphoesterase [Anaerolineales bacterium]